MARFRILGAVMTVVLTMGICSFSQAAMLDTVKGRGALVVGVAGTVPGFSAPDEKGLWKGIDVDYGRAVACAIFGSPDKVKFVPTTTKERFTALQTGEIDVLSRNTTWSLQRDTEQGLDFTGILFYDGQGFMVSKGLGIKSAKELDGASICIQMGTTTERNVSEYFAANKMSFKPVSFESADEATVLYDKGRCDVYTTDISGLAARRTALSKPEEHVILADVISKEPLGPSVRQGDQAWADINRWVLSALLVAEELGVTSKNVDAMLKSEVPAVRHLLGVEGKTGEMLGLPKDWAYQMIKHVGNYGEIFERNVGANTPLKLERGLNAQWNQGGLMYGLPVR